ncbi:GNAT family N-acetyltransferase [Sporosalibacterium faouarense]|uniref:GNAT family N-acetyltransferase n=1 Tax=Sporosalibacterium faouarense TaxID=516123 RepID=UPI00192B9B79|nr:GNAT family N-acetyltransferase [Sporosalibacterium faouarense]
MSKVKSIPKEDFKYFVEIARNAYPRMKASSVEDREKTAERFAKIQEENENQNFYGLYRDNKLLGGMLHYDFVMNYDSQIIDAGGVGFVGVEFLHKKEKVAKELITFYLNHYKEREIYMAVLYPFRPDFYKKMGFGYGTKMNQYRISPKYLPKGESKNNVFFAGEKDKIELLDCYNRCMKKTHGMIKKNLKDIENIFKNSENRVIAYRTNNKIEGYLIFNFKYNDNDSFLENDLNVSEFICEKKEALSEILTFLNTQSDQIRYIILNTQDEFFHHLLSNPVNGTNNIIPSVYHESNVQGVGLMYRVIDIRGIFKVLGEHNFGNESCKIKLNIEDSFISENDGSYIIDFKNGKANLSEDEDFQVEVSMDISDFSSLLMGVINFRNLCNYGLVRISDDSYISKINKIFHIEEKPKCTTAF